MKRDLQSSSGAIFIYWIFGNFRKVGISSPTGSKFFNCLPLVFLLHCSHAIAAKSNVENSKIGKRKKCRPYSERANQGRTLGRVGKALECEAGDHTLLLDMKEVKLVDRDVVSFLASCEAKGVNIVNCPAYIREWIQKEAAHISVLKMSKGF